METETIETTDTIRVLHKVRDGRCDFATVTAPEGATDDELADAAGFNGSHYGRDVKRYDDGTALVTLWND